MAPRIIPIKRKFFVVDILVVLAFVLGVIFFLYLRSLRSTAWMPVTVIISSDQWFYPSGPPPEWYGRSLSIGQSSINTFGNKTAEIIGIQNYDLGGGSRKIIIDVNLLTAYDKRTQTYSFNYQPLQIGKPIDLTFGTNNVTGLVSYIGKNGIPKEEKTIEVKMFAVHPWTAVSYSKGLKSTDYQGNTVAEILDVSSVDAQNYEFIDTYGRRYVVPGTDSTRKDVTVKLKILTTKIKNVNYFIDGSEIKIGAELWISFPNTVIRSSNISAILD
jgi:hypothetical protein